MPLLLAILFFVTFSSLSKSIRVEHRLKNYLFITGVGLLLYFISDQATIEQHPYPPYGLITLVFLCLSSYLVFVGLLSSAISTQKEKFYGIIKKLNSEKKQKEIELFPLTSLKSSLLDIKDKLDSLRIQYSELSKYVVESMTTLEYCRDNKEKLKRDVLENKKRLDKKKFLEV